ncbi:MAG: ferric reductase-like transmembrane domain-containing protein [Granulosicoccaceae bacterium]
MTDMTAKLNMYGLWVLLSMPGVWLLWLWASGDSTAHYLLLPSGKYSIRAGLVALAATPLKILFPKAGFSMWLIKTRRTWGVACCGYGLLHTLFYLIDEGGLLGALGDIRDIEIIAGWLAMLVLLVLGVTSNNWSVKRLGRRWKSLQRLSYLAIALSFAHWFLLGYYQLALWLHLLPLLTLQVIRIMLSLRKAKLPAIT